ncbi:hypothetical protein EDD85DRAFT_999986 [Armillaria nabsnona]|nr:hypothetical protein EDD85DRAFT_999986 [Armillaria nabsnona]
MSSTSLPFRARCIQVHGAIACGCPWFIPPVSPMLDQSSCARCGHGIHGHVDYVSMFIHCCAATQCAAYVQKTPQTQACTCSAQLVDHGLTANQYLPVDPSNITGLFRDNVQANDTWPISGIYTPSTNVDSAAPDIIQPQAYDFGALPQMEHTVTCFIIQNHQDIYALGVAIAPRT